MESLILHRLLKMLNSRDECEIETQALKCTIPLIRLTMVFKRQEMSSLLPPCSGWTRALSPISVRFLVLKDVWTWLDLPFAMSIEELHVGRGELEANLPCFRLN